MAAPKQQVSTLILSQTKNSNLGNQCNSLNAICSKISAEIQKLIHTLPDKQIKNLAEDGVEVDRINNSCNHEVLQQDPLYPHLRILRVTVKKGKREFFHQHELPSVMLIFSAASIKLAQVGEIFENLPSRKSPAGSTFFIPSEPSHAVENVDPENDFGALRFEFKKVIAAIELQKKLVSLIAENKEKLMQAALEYTHTHPTHDDHHAQNSKTTSFSAKK